MGEEMMMKKGCLILLLSVYTCLLLAVPADMTPQCVVMANGDSILVVLHGDEYVSWYETDDGQVILPTESGMFEYATETLSHSGRVAKNRAVRPTADSVFLATLDKGRMYQYFNEWRYRQIVREDSIGNIIDESDSTTTISLVANPALMDLFRCHQDPLLGTLNTKKILTILIQFQDVKFTLGDNTKFYNLMNQTGYSYNGNSGSVKDFYYENSYGQLTLQTTVVGPYTASHNQAYYGENDPTINNIVKDRRAKELVKEAVNMAAKQIDMAQFDNDGDGFVDCVHIIVAGHGENENTQKYLDAIWPHRGQITAILRDGKWIKKYIITPELYLQDLSPIGVICHELGHMMGAPDFYDLNDSIDGYFLGGDKWDVMSSGGYNNRKKTPAHHNPYTKTQIFGWANTTELSGTNRLYTLPPSHSNRNAFYTIQTSTAGEYYILENRQQQKFDTALPGHGLVVWHIHVGIMDDRYAINTQHPQKCYPVYAAATEPIPSGTMDSYGILYSSNTPFPGGSQNIFFTSTSTPRLQSWAGEVVQGKNICFIQENGSNVQFVLNPEIQGPSQFCDTASYTLTHVPAGATIMWKNYNRMNLTYPYYIKSGQGTSRVLYQRGKQDDGRLHRPNFVSPDYTGSAVVSATVSLNGHSYTVSKNVYIGTIAPQVLLYNAQGTMQVAPRVGASYRLLVNNCTDVADNQFHWVVSSSVQEFERLGQGRYFPLTIDEQQTVTAQVSYSTDECGTVTTTKTFSFTLPVTSSSASLVFRNPAGVGEDLEVGIVLPDENPSSTTYGLRPNTEIGAYTLELWSELYGRVRAVEADTPTTQMSLSGLNAGTYFLKLIINNEIVATQQLIIK